MVLDRRQMMMGSVGLGAGLAATAAGPRHTPAQAAAALGTARSVTEYGVRPNAKADQTAKLQSTIDAAAKAGIMLHFPAGEYQSGGLTLRSGAILSGVPGRSVLKFSGDAALTARSAESIRLSGLVIDGGGLAPVSKEDKPALLDMDSVEGLIVTDCKITGSIANGISLNRCAGRVADNEITQAALTGLFCNDSAGLDISHNVVHRCGNNGIQVWRSAEGEDGTLVAHNRVEEIRADNGGSGQNGNGIKVFRAGSVQIIGNRISDCMLSAIRGKAASNLQIVGNSCARLGEVAIYAEFGFEGTVIANNLVDRAALGVSITNFKEGGRMAVAQGNLIRNLFQRDGKRGIGISVEADAIVTGNLIEGAPNVGIQIGWGKYLRDVNASGNLIREARIGIGISISPEAGYAFVTNNMISVTADGGVRAMDHGKPLGPDLARTSSESYRNIAVFGNVSL